MASRGARRGRFGRLPRSVPSLSATIVAIAREMDQQKTQNMFDAWKNGGEVDGAPVTDERLLKFIQQKRDGTATNDPLWDQWNETLTQYRYAIGESKHNLAFQQGKLSAQGMADWYKSQLKSIPVNSEFYRTVAGNAAQWAKQAQNAARGGARSRADAALQAVQQNSANQQAIYDAATEAINKLAQAAYASGTAVGLENIDVKDFEAIVNGAGITINGHRLTMSYWQQLGRNAIKAANSEIRALDQAGRSSRAARGRRQTITTSVARIRGLDIRAAYGQLRQQHEHDLAAAQNDPDEVARLNREYAMHLASLRDTSIREGDDPILSGLLNNEISVVTTGVATGPTMQDAYGHNNATGHTSSQTDADETAASYAKLITQQQGLGDGTLYYGQDRPGGTYGVRPVPTGSHGTEMPDNLQPSVMSINGEPKTVYVAGAPIEGRRLLDKQGHPVDQTILSPEALANGVTNGTYKWDTTGTVGYQFTSSDGTPFWGIYDRTGKLNIVMTDPFGAGALTTDGGHTYVTTDGNGIIQGGGFTDGTQTDTNGKPLPSNTPINEHGNAIGAPVAIDNNLSNNQLLSWANKQDATNPAAAEAARAAVGARTLMQRVGEGPGSPNRGSIAAGFSYVGRNPFTGEQTPNLLSGGNIYSTPDASGQQFYTDPITGAQRPVIHSSGATVKSAPPQRRGPGYAPSLYGPNGNQPSIKPPPVIHVPQLPVVQQGKDTGDISYKPAPVTVTPPTTGGPPVGSKKAV